MYIFLHHCPLFTSDLNDHLFDVQSELNPVAANWRNIGIALRLKVDVLENIDTKFKGDPDVCLSHMVTEWLKKNYNWEKFGEPTWQRLVKAVDHPAGGANTALASKIASRHKAKGGTVATKAAERSRSAGEASLRAAVMKLARKCKSESEANSEITEQGGVLSLLLPGTNCKHSLLYITCDVKFGVISV